MSLIVSNQDVHGWVTAAIQAFKESYPILNTLQLPKLPKAITIKGGVSVAGLGIGVDLTIAPSDKGQE
jgi:hypothetical protein